MVESGAQSDAWASEFRAAQPPQPFAAPPAATQHSTAQHAATQHAAEWAAQFAAAGPSASGGPSAAAAAARPVGPAGEWADEFARGVADLRLGEELSPDQVSVCLIEVLSWLLVE